MVTSRAFGRQTKNDVYEKNLLSSFYCNYYLVGKL
jgi:hypothetical protein